ncbi:MAG: hypothetical protein NWE78_00405 [Candidatus Bathyarchaeota archaeon]|nr:hypothetical protein [Candidatus Bathyarchaeota archaeon]
MSEFSDYSRSVNLRHPMKGNDAFLVVEYGAYVKPASAFLHPSPIVEQQSVELHISTEECERIVASGAKGDTHDGTVKMFVDIDGIQAVSSGEVKSGWEKWVYIISSFGVKLDEANHEIKIRAEQWVSEVLGLGGRWQRIFEDTRTLKFSKASKKRREDILARFSE